MKKAWIMWGLGASFFLFLYVARVAPSVMRPQLMHSFLIDGYTFGILSAFFYYAYIPMQIPVGILIDKFGPRKLLTIAISCTAIGAFLFSESHSLHTAELSRFLIGLGSAFGFVGGIKLAKNWFGSKHFGMLTGATQGLGMFGAVVGGAPVAFGVTYIGWRHTMWVITAIFVVLAVLVYLIVRDQPSNHSQPSDTTRRSTARRDRIGTSIKIVLSSRQTWLNFCYMALLYGPTTAFGELWGVSCLRRLYHISTEMAAIVIGVLFIGWAIGSPLLGAYSDKIKRRKPVMFGAAILSLLFLAAIIYIPNVPLVVLFGLAFLYGISNSGCASSYAVAGESCPAIVTGTAVAITNMASILIGTFCQPLIGWLLDRFWGGKMLEGARIYSAHDYRLAMGVLLVLLVLGAVFALLVRETHCQQTDYY